MDVEDEEKSEHVEIFVEQGFTEEAWEYYSKWKASESDRPEIRVDTGR